MSSESCGSSLLVESLLLSSSVLESVGSEFDECCYSCCVLSSVAGRFVCIGIWSRVTTSGVVGTSEEKGLHSLQVHCSGKDQVRGAIVCWMLQWWCRCV